VRELEQVLRAALATAAGDEIGAADLRLAAPPPPPAAAAAPPPPAADGDDERARILAALEACAGNQTRAARMLGISRTTMITKLRIYKIPRPTRDKG